MVSVLLPIYNTDVRSFVHELLQQFEKNQIDGEVICMDDCSQNEYKILNREISDLPKVNYIELETNLGRSKIRNKLALTAQYDWLIFADGDHRVCTSNYVGEYLKHSQNINQVVYGGTAYGPKPENKSFLLHWQYGTQRECINSINRNKNKFGTFKTNNFFIHKSVFNAVQFNEEVKGYGHEDTLFAKDLSRKGFEIVHIDNPLQHDGLEANVTFLDKQYNAIKNLAFLYKQNLVGNEIRLIKFYSTMRKSGLIWLVKLVYLKNENKLKANLLSSEPSLTNLDRLKLSWFLKLIQ